MSRLLCSVVFAFSVALLAFGPTVAFANPPCGSGPNACYHGQSDNTQDTCKNSGCTEKNPHHCFSSQDSKC
jgi:hypothetical protein